MKVTSAQANKILRKLNDDKAMLLENESESSTFVAATVENIEDARPAYSYDEVRRRVNELDSLIRRVKHAINLFNTKSVLPGTDMTIDEALVYIPQLTQRKNSLYRMRLTPEKQRRDTSRGTNIIEYTYANFDPKKAGEDYDKASDELARLQNALDLVNSTVEFEMDITM